MADEAFVGVEPDNRKLEDGEIVRGVADRLAERVAEGERLDLGDLHAEPPRPATTSAAA